MNYYNMLRYSVAGLLMCLLSLGLHAQQIAKDRPEFDHRITRVMDSLKIPGLSLALIEDNKVIYAKGYGLKNQRTRQPVDDSTLFEACSLSKMFLVYVAYQLVDEGLLDLEKPLYQYLPEERLEHDARYKRITARMVLSHTSGLENWQGANNGDTLEILNEPGAAFTYSGEGFHYLAAVIGNILHEPYKEYVTKRVLVPLGLTHTRLYFQPGDTSGDYANGHNIMNGPFDKWITDQPWPASSVNTTAAEYATLIIHMFDRHMLSGSSIHKMTDTACLIGQYGKATHYLSNGFFLLINDGDTIVNFSGNNYGFKGDLMYSIVHKKGYVMFTNNDLGILADPVINEMSTKFKVNFYFNQEFYARSGYLFSLIRTYQTQGTKALIEKVNKSLKAPGNFDQLDALDNLMVQLFWIDRAAGEQLANVLLRWRPDFGGSYAVLGAANLDEHHQYELARTYFLKARELNYMGMDVPGYLQRCEATIAAVQKK